MTQRNRRLAMLLLTAGAVVALAIPTLAASPGPPAEPPGQAKADKPPKGPKVDVTVRGTLVAATDEKGRPTFTITSGGTTWEISAGPKWFLGDANPLAAYVGKSVTVVGSHREGDLTVSADTVNGTALREAGRPAWAGGPRAVGESHPGWKGWHSDGKPGNGVGRDGAPGQQKKASPAP